MDVFTIATSVLESTFDIYPDILMFFAAILAYKVTTGMRPKRKTPRACVKQIESPAGNSDSEQVRCQRDQGKPNTMVTRDELSHTFKMQENYLHSSVKHLAKAVSGASLDDILFALRRVDAAMRQGQDTARVLVTAYNEDVGEELSLTDYPHWKSLAQTIERLGAYRHLFRHLCTCKTLATPVLGGLLAHLKSSVSQEASSLFASPGRLLGALSHADEELQNGFLEFALEARFPSMEVMARLESVMIFFEAFATVRRGSDAHFVALLDAFMATGPQDTLEKLRDMQDIGFVDHRAAIELNVLLASSALHGGEISAVASAMLALDVSPNQTVKRLLAMRADAGDGQIMRCLDTFDACAGMLQ